MPPNPSPNGQREFRDCLGHFATGVTVVACRIEGAPHGATVNAFTAVSLDPPLVLVSLDRRSKASRYLADTPFTVNVLAADSAAIALHFAGRTQTGVDLTWLDHDVAPRLAGAAAWLACTPWAQSDGGDHILFLGEVRDFATTPVEPLLFHRGRFRRPGAHLDDSVPAARLAEAGPWLESLDCPSAAGWFGAIADGPLSPAHG